MVVSTISKLNSTPPFGIIPVKHLGATDESAGAAFKAPICGEDNLTGFFFAVKAGRTEAKYLFQTGVFSMPGLIVM